MKAWVRLILACLTVLPPLALKVGCEQPVHCQWGPYGDWSECDGCTKTQRRTRAILVYAQFGGTPCSGEHMMTQGCSPKRGCPLEQGCGERFRCFSGQCISMALVCNGDQDCEEDRLDEQDCEESSSSNVCDDERVPPNVELTGKGFNVLTGKLRGSVINTKSFGGQCRKVFSGDSRYFYRLPQSLIGYTFQVKIENDFNDEFYDSSWSYVKHTEKIQTSNEGHHYQTFHEELSNKKTHRLMIVKNEVEVAQFQNNAPQYLPLSEEFWKALLALPTVYDYATYRGLIERYGTHYLSEGTLGGQYSAMLGIDSASESQMSSSSVDFHECVTSKHNFLFFSWSTTSCNSFVNSARTASGSATSRIPVHSDIIGGDPSYINGLKILDLQNPAGNRNMYMKWAGSVKNFPTAIKPKLRPLYELVKEVPCVAVKRLHLKRAIEAYRTEEHPCHCRPCQNNGLPVLSGTTCTCICKSDTSGPACEHGTVLGEQPGLIHGGWTCWSTWSNCYQGQRSRTRTCSNPYPRGGGAHCVGEPAEHKLCEDEDLEHLRSMEPHCFDPSLSPAKSCKTPPPLVNGIVLDPKDTYLVGSKVVYSCVEGYHVVGDTTAECAEDLRWKRNKMECRSTVCVTPPLSRDVMGSPWKLTYEIGETITLSCPSEKVRMGAPEIQCDSSLNWYPQPEGINCTIVPPEPPVQTDAGCKPWEKSEKGSCVCKMPYECRSSLEVCATVRRNVKHRLSVCKMKALICLGQGYVLAEDSACQWPSHESAPCNSCQLWEMCDEQTGTCRCKEPAECSEPGALVCVKLGDDAVAKTMSECEAGLRRCRGERVSVVSVEPC
ncbi:hypothetical protein AAFF_G00066220 [Aldrovandia affinis]|uniref:Complement component C7 n=1 Tax=Aldrovandia affinis TaxID=143900 RepID=A0AAD7T3Z6_9TELE|nr:hypothetical protein AAFF_G00066220 [Aldrovandia affinis]